MNYFADANTARRYDAARPYFHPQLINRICDLLPKGVQIRHALDVGCGTGQSARALLAFRSIDVIGVDGSEAMLSYADRVPQIRYVAAQAEHLPFTAEQFEIVSVSSAFHWFDRIVFLREARRVLCDDGWLLVYDDGFVGAMKENDAFSGWWKGYLQKFPSPPRHSQPLTDGEIESAGFKEQHSGNFTHEETYNFEHLCMYLTTQTNIIAALNNRQATEDSVSGWFEETLRPMFADAIGAFQFRCQFKLFRANSRLPKCIG